MEREEKKKKNWKEWEKKEVQDISNCVETKARFKDRLKRRILLY